MNVEKFIPKNEEGLSFLKKMKKQEMTKENAREVQSKINDMIQTFSFLNKTLDPNIKYNEIKDSEEYNECGYNEKENIDKYITSIKTSLRDESDIFNFKNETIGDILKGLEEAEEELDETIEDIDTGRIRIKSNKNDSETSN